MSIAKVEAEGHRAIAARDALHQVRRRLQTRDASTHQAMRLSFEEAICHQAGASINDIVRTREDARDRGASIADILIARGHMGGSAYAAALARACGFGGATEQASRNPCFAASAREPWRYLGRPRIIPAGGGRSVLLCADLFPARLLHRFAESLGASRHRVRLIGREALSALLERTGRPFLLRRAIGGLARMRPDESARDGLWLWQMLVMTALAGLFTGAALFLPRQTLFVLSAIFSVLFFLTIAIRTAAVIYMIMPARTGPPPTPIRDADLPRYSVLVPLFRETRVLPSIVRAMMRLDYPPEKLDIKLVLEAVDTDMIAAVRKLRLPGNFHIVIVPDAQPRTKPKALNYALQFATGDLLVIYDAEDRPEPDQLRKAAQAFAAAPPEVVCLQARLGFYNARENWIAGQFAIEYACLFHGILPMLDRLRLPIPLGGTSNHFRIEALRQIGAWDAFNVTEDADLGMRLYRHGLRCRTLASQTGEEAACHFGNWVRQRSRWLKGWMQTYAVHMRRPFRLWRELGAAGFLVFQGQFAGIILSALVHPIFYLLLIYDAVNGTLFAASEHPLVQSFLALAMINLVSGYVSAALLGVAVLTARRMWRLIPQIMLIPLYWLMISFAAYRAVYQAVVKPFHWDKTEHGVSAAAGAQNPVRSASRGGVMGKAKPGPVSGTGRIV